MKSKPRSPCDRCFHPRLSSHSTIHFREDYHARRTHPHRFREPISNKHTLSHYTFTTFVVLFFA